MMALRVMLCASWMGSAGHLPSYGDPKPPRHQGYWRNISVSAAAVGVVTVSSDSRVLTVIGLGGPLYSTARYTEDRKSRKPDELRRAALFRHRSIYVHGRRYTRRTIWRDHAHYYEFVRV